MILTKIHKKLIVVQVIKFKIKYFDLTIYQMNRNNDAYIFCVEASSSRTIIINSCLSLKESITMVFVGIFKLLYYINIFKTAEPN